jgi:hypothetical protein
MALKKAMSNAQDSATGLTEYVIPRHVSLSASFENEMTILTNERKREYPVCCTKKPKLLKAIQNFVLFVQAKLRLRAQRRYLRVSDQSAPRQFLNKETLSLISCCRVDLENTDDKNILFNDFATIRGVSIIIFWFIPQRLTKLNLSHHLRGING